MSEILQRKQQRAIRFLNDIIDMYNEANGDFNELYDFLDTANTALQYAYEVSNELKYSRHVNLDTRSNLRVELHRRMRFVEGILDTLYETFKSDFD